MNIIEIAGIPGLRVAVASTFWQRLVGLLGKRRLAYDSALLLVPCNNIHTAFMCFAIDVVFIDLTGTVVAIYPRLRPFGIAVAPGAYACLELCGGAAERYGLAIGQRLASPDTAIRFDAVHQSSDGQFT
ncbi:DUF192 domain-containing protein [Actimicrobium sp. CCC2.4]|uniref:DUF192 domain-containing protein n=1 Tax=Actimicrobium sp. CCC2.4 TaxID=3048606 RepID=UPI002AC92B9E|nr:DUF192 domain-containing protein [Actimicrobium sp. CCC2.4]MEB0135207.1 DUF192 domain-containing protein [Actimicrobium sp. CCC2.4]WPX31003.1 DUF192 domain-containing protein [Actimicrobium sp. CCC2.4]